MEKSNEKEEPRTSFREIFNRNVNLLTILGIFNALAIYSSSLVKKSIAMPLSFIFSILSIVVLWVIIMDIPKYKEKNLKYEFLITSLILCQFLMVANIVMNYLDLIAGFFLLVIFFLEFYFISISLMKYVFVRFKKFDFKKFNFPNIMFAFVLLILIPFEIFLARFITKYVVIFLDFLFIQYWK
jgi:hypothetical protein